VRKQTKLQAAVTGIAALAASGLAQAIQEIEDNHPITSAQDVSTTGVSINGYVGQVKDDDVDYYKFRARAGDVVTVRINALFGGMEDLYATIGLFGPGSELPLIDQQTFDYAVYDDPILKEIRIPADGVYTVGVTNWPRVFVDGGVSESSSDPSWYGPDHWGDYTLEIKSAAPSFVPVNIKIDPDGSGPRMLNPKADYDIAVAILSNPGFAAGTIDTSTLTFGATGDEDSLRKCDVVGRDVNGDGRVDLVCHFSNRKAGWSGTETSGILKGMTTSRTPFGGSANLGMVPAFDESGLEAKAKKSNAAARGRGR
jgi:hypothetical protein